MKASARVSGAGCFAQIEPLLWQKGGELKLKMKLPTSVKLMEILTTVET